MGDVLLARELWSHVENPLHCALLASNLLRKLSKVITASTASPLLLHLYFLASTSPRPPPSLLTHF